MMHGRGKSSPVIVATKPANKAARSATEPSVKEPAAAESVEPRAGAKGNADRQSTRRTQSRVSVSQALQRIRKVARERKEGKVHRALPPYQWRPARGGVLRTQGERSTRRGSADVEGLRGRP